MFEILEFIDNHLWQFVGFPLIIVLGLHLTYLSRAVQIRKFPNAIRTFVQFLRTKETCERGIHPLKAFLRGSVAAWVLVILSASVQPCKWVDRAPFSGSGSQPF